MRRADIVWIDVVVPAGIAPDDVRGSMVWIGECWQAALQPLVDRSLLVHDGPMVDSAWSEFVCFAGVGPGEVLDDGAKLVGLSQRRTRHGIRVQGLIYCAEVADDYRSFLRGDLPASKPTGQAWSSDIDPNDVSDRLATAVQERISPV